MTIGQEAVTLAERYFVGEQPVRAEPTPAPEAALAVFPSPVVAGRSLTIRLAGAASGVAVEVFDVWRWARCRRGAT